MRNLLMTKQENKICTGIGSRKTPVSIEPTICTISKKLSSLNVILRSGGAPGADQMFETYWYGPKEIYLPWEYFERNPSPLYNISQEAMDMALHYYTNSEWLKTQPGTWKIMARNCYQVLGLDLKTPTDFVVFWNPDNKTGGTSQALRICKDYGIPTFNLNFEREIYSLASYIKNLY